MRESPLHSLLLRPEVTERRGECQLVCVIPAWWGKAEMKPLFSIRSHPKGPKDYFVGSLSGEAHNPMHFNNPCQTYGKNVLPF